MPKTDTGVAQSACIGIQFGHFGGLMKPYLEHIKSSQEGSWTLFDRRLPAIPFEWHYNSEYELTLTLNSRGQRFIGDNISPYDDGDLVLMGPRIPHTWCSSADICPEFPHQALVLWFSEGFVQSMIRPHIELWPIFRMLERSSRGLDFSGPARTEAGKQIRAMLDKSAEERLPALLQLLLLLSHDNDANPIASAAIQYEAISNVMEERIGRVVTYLHSHYQREVDVEHLSHIAACSRSSLHRLFKLQTRMTITDYVSHLRIGKACAMLLNTTRPIALIADSVGYQNLAHFNRQFRALKNQTPKQFRRLFQL
jgi:AraC-like DNA-binding protein